MDFRSCFYSSAGKALSDRQISRAGLKSFSNRAIIPSCNVESASSYVIEHIQLNLIECYVFDVRSVNFYGVVKSMLS